MRPPPPPVPAAVHVGPSEGVKAEPAEDDTIKAEEFYDSDEDAGKPMTNLNLLWSGPEPDRNVHNIVPYTLNAKDDDQSVHILVTCQLERHLDSVKKAVMEALGRRDRELVPMRLVPSLQLWLRQGAGAREGPRGLCPGSIGWRGHRDGHSRRWQPTRCRWWPLPR